MLLWNICAFSHELLKKCQRNTHSTNIPRFRGSGNKVWKRSRLWPARKMPFTPNLPKMCWSQASIMNLKCLRESRETRVFPLWRFSQFRTPLDYWEIFEKVLDLYTLGAIISNSIWHLLGACYETGKAHSVHFIYSSLPSEVGLSSPFYRWIN